MRVAILIAIMLPLAVGCSKKTESGATQAAGSAVTAAGSAVVAAGDQAAAAGSDAVAVAGSAVAAAGDQAADATVDLPAVTDYEAQASETITAKTVAADLKALEAELGL